MRVLERDVSKARSEQQRAMNGSLLRSVLRRSEANNAKQSLRNAEQLLSGAVQRIHENKAREAHMREPWSQFGNLSSIFTSN
jgi:hypothetical protein